MGTTLLHRELPPSSSATLRTSAAARIVAGVLITAMTIVWTWWALSDGAFFGTVMLPGSIVIFAALAVTIGLANLPISTRGPHAVAIAALLGLAVWTAISILWSPAGDLALEASQRTLLYATALAAGVVLSVALRRRLFLSLVPILVAGAVALIVVLIHIWTASSVKGLVDGEGTLSFPFGYRNANAGFFVIVWLCATACSARLAGGPVVRISSAALASGALAVAAISQSRGSLLAGVAGVAVLVLSSPDRGRTLLSVGLTIVPVAATFSYLLGPFHAATAVQPILPELDTAALAVAATILLGAALMGVMLLIERGSVGERSLDIPLRRVIAVGSVGLALAFIGVVVVAGSPLHWFDDSAAATTDAAGTASGSRFTYSGDLNRTDFWRVALDEAADDPLAGGGAGSFRSRYLLQRDTDEQPRDAHSLPLEILSELGLVGLLLAATAFGAAVLGALRARRLGPEAAQLACVALGALGAWGTQALVDWSWSFAGLTAPVIALIGAACGPVALALQPLRAATTRPAIALLVAASLLAVPTFISDRLALDAALGWRTDPDKALENLGTAAKLNPLTDEPFLVEAEIARLRGDNDRALAALDDAESREPTEFKTWLLRARIQQQTDPEAARVTAQHALELNPRSREAARIAGATS